MVKGAFHRYLGIDEKKPVPLGRAMAALKRAKSAGDSHVREMAQFAVNMKRAKGGTR